MRLLVVEDEEKLAQALKRGLDREGYATDYVMDGEAAVRRLELHHSDYDLVVLDLMLPKKDGFEVCRDVRTRNIKIPILVLTARGLTEDKIKALDSGADDYLVKPFSFEELVARIKTLLRRPSESLPTELRIKDLVIDTTAYKVSRAGEELKLTLKEFRILEYLMQHPNQVIRREELIDHVWDFASGALSNVVDVHIKNLRKKVDEGYEEKLIETIRGVGYRINA